MYLLLLGFLYHCQNEGTPPTHTHTFAQATLLNCRNKMDRIALLSHYHVLKAGHQYYPQYTPRSILKGRLDAPEWTSPTACLYLCGVTMAFMDQP